MLGKVDHPLSRLSVMSILKVVVVMNRLIVAKSALPLKASVNHEVVSLSREIAGP